MERNREARRASMSATNGLSRRRHSRSTSLRDSPKADEQLELQETVRLRNRVQKKVPDREFSNRNKRRRGDRYVQSSNRDEVEQSSEESVDNDEDDYEEEDGRVPRMLPSNQPLPPASLSNHSHRRSFAQARVVRSSPVWKPDEMIAVPIPRRARSASAKRSHEYWVDVGLGDEQSHGRPSTSPPGGSIDGAPPPSSNVSGRKKMRPIGPKIRLPKVPSKLPSSSSSAQDDIEIEVAEALYGLMKQSQWQPQSTKQETITQNQVEKLHSNGKSDTGSKSGCSPLASTQTTPRVSNLPQDNCSSSSPLLGSGSKRKRTEDMKDEEENAVVLTQNGSVLSVTKADSEQSTKMEAGISSPMLEKKTSEEASIDLGTSQAMVAASLESQKEEAVKQDENSKPPTQESGDGDVVVAKEELAASKEESPPCALLAVDPVDSTRTKANLMALEAETKRGAKFEIDLMAPPTMASSPERDGFIDLVAGPKIIAEDVEMKTAKNEYKSKQRVKNEEVVGLQEKKIKTIYVKQEPLKLDLEMPDQNNGGTSGSNRLEQLDQKQQQQSIASVLEGEKSAQSSSLPSPIAVAGWPSSLPLGCMPPLQTIMPMGGTFGSSPEVQPPPFILSQPRPKRCATHHHIAHNISHHKQFTKMNHNWPAAAGPASVYGAKPYNLNVVPSQNMIHGRPLLGGFPNEEGQGLATVPSLSGKDKSSEVTNIMNATQKKQLVFQQAPQPVPAANLLHGPAYIFPLSQLESAAGTTAANETGLHKSATSASNGPLSGKSATGAPVSSSSLPAMASAVSFNYPNLPVSEAPPYMAILQNNGYPFPISTNVGMSPQFIGGTHAPAMSFFNGSFYSSPVFHYSQDQQQQPRSQPLVQPVHQLMSTSSGSPSQLKQVQSQQQLATQIHGHNFLTSTTSQLKHPQKQHLLPSHSSRKHKSEITEGENPLIADNQPQKGVYSPNFAVPVQPMNFALIPPVTLGRGGSGGCNHGEKQQRQQGAKGGVGLIPQAFALSFASFNGSGTASALDFSSMAQNPAIFQTLPDMGRHGYQIAYAPQAVKQMNEGKTGGDSASLDSGREAILAKSPTSFGQSLTFSKPGPTVHDNSARTINFISSPVPESQPSRSTSTITPTTYVTANPPSSQQQQQLIQIQKQHMMQQQMHQQQLNRAAQIKAPTPSSLPASSIAAKFPNNTLAFSQTLAQANNSGQSPHWKNSARTQNLPQQQVRNPQSQTQISFGGSSKPGAAPHGQQIVINHQSSAPSVGSPPNSCISRSSGSSSKTVSMSGKASPAISALPSQQSESSSNEPSQKSSPVCTRNVPSILRR